MSDSPSIYQNPAALLQRLLQFDTTNPPGNEMACIQYLNNQLQEAGIETTILAQQPERPNLVARLPGRGEVPPLLLQGHVDVVTTANQEWQHPPFSGHLEEGIIWGRGALDMKGGVAMMVAAFLRMQEEGPTPPGDIILTILSDEEAGGNLGARFLVEQHPELFEGVRYAIGEFGGFSIHLGGQRFYPVMVAEKQICWMTVTLRGPGGHGSRPIYNGAMAHLGKVLTALTEKQLPIHLTPVPEQMIRAMQAALPQEAAAQLGRLLDAEQTGTALAEMGEEAGLFGPMLRNTVSPTLVEGGYKINVIPSEIRLQLDGRLLPGFTPEQMLAELEQMLGDKVPLGEDVTIEINRYDPGPSEPDMGLFETLSEILQDADPGSVPVPLMLTGVTDARFFSQLGIQTYGFLPMNLPPDFPFMRMVHAADERIPAESVAFGADCVYQALQRFGA